MGEIETAIEAYINDVITLTKTDISSAVKSREWFVERLEKVIASRTNEPVLYSDEQFVYYGSYFKGTKVAAVDEFDILVVIDSNTGVFSQSNIPVGKGVGSSYPNHKYDQSFMKSDNSGVSPTKMLNWLKGVVQEVVEPFGGEAPDRNGQAITATIKSKNLKVDLVPAGVFKRTSDELIFYDIPKGDKDNGWLITSPRLDIKRLNDIAVDKKHFKNVIRIAKRIRDTYNFQVSSFAIETAIANYCDGGSWHDNLYNDLRSVLLNLANTFREGVILDPFDTKTNMISGVESLEWYAERLDGIVTDLDEYATMPEQGKMRDCVRSLFDNEK